MAEYLPEERKKSSPNSGHPWKSAFSRRRILATEADGSAPARRSGQRVRVLHILQEAGGRGVTNLELTFMYRVSQSASRVFELRDEGWRIDSVPSGKRDGSVTYILRGRSESGEPAKSPKDFFAKRATGLPLFDAAEVR